jgi:hypothetical protein
MDLDGVTGAGGSAAGRLGTEANASRMDATPATPIRIKVFMDMMVALRGRFVKMETEYVQFVGWNFHPFSHYCQVISRDVISRSHTHPRVQDKKVGMGRGDIGAPSCTRLSPKNPA